MRATDGFRNFILMMRREVFYLLICELHGLCETLVTYPYITKALYIDAWIGRYSGSGGRRCGIYRKYLSVNLCPWSAQHDTLTKLNLRGIAISDTWVMRLYIAGETESSKHAIRNLRDICDEYLKDRCEIEVVDLKKHPELAAKEQIFAIPTLVKELPLPVRKLIGDLHATKKVLLGLDLIRKDHKKNGA